MLRNAGSHGCHRYHHGQDKQQVLHWQQHSQSDFELPVAIVLFSCAHSLQATTQGESLDAAAK